MKIGVTTSLSESTEALKLFDYVETYDIPLYSQAYHSKCYEDNIKGNYLYIVKHIDCKDLSLIADSLVLYENVYSLSYEEIVKRLGSRKFLLDVGHAFISDMKSKGVFELEKWLSLNPIAIHLHNVKYVPDPTGNIYNAPYADHQPLNDGLINMKEVLDKIRKAGIEYVTIEVFFKDYMPTSYTLKEKRRWIEDIIKGLI